MTLRASERQLGDIFRVHGRAGLEQPFGLNTRAASVIIELLQTGTCGLLERLEGRPLDRLASVPGLGRLLAERIEEDLGIEELEELATAADDGRLSLVAGMGPRRIAAVRAAVGIMLGRPPRTDPSRLPRRPDVETLLEIDRLFREAARAGTIPLVGTRPVQHGELRGWTYTAMYANTGVAVLRARTHDWVVIVFHDADGPEGQLMVVTELRGPMRARRIVRGCEHECARYLDQLRSRELHAHG